MRANCPKPRKGSKSTTEENQKMQIKFNDELIISKSRDEWIDELTEFQINLAYEDGAFCNGLLDDFLRRGFKGYDNMTDEELVQEVINELGYSYEGVQL